MRAIRTTHVGSLPRSQPVVDQIFSREKGEPVDEATFDAIMAAAIDDCVARQVAAGVDIVSDGEMSKISYLARIEVHVEALNFALAAIPADRVRMHVCWGNHESPHHKDVPLATILPTVLKAKPQGLLFETANPRHGHEWATIREMQRQIPQDKVLIPGVLDTTTNFIEHPELIAQRLQRFVDVVGAERVIAGSDCGFGTFAGFGAVDEDIVYAKLASMAEGAASVV
jgi:5-methyltetrahydropteroyltriglutamate--homocysteine methyltransferase